MSTAWRDPHEPTQAARSSRRPHAPSFQPRRLGAALYLYLGVPLVAVAMVLLAWGGGR